MDRPLISAFIAQSLDGFIATDDNSIDWLTAAAAPDEDYGFDAFLEQVDVIVMGRGTYEFIKDVELLPYGSRPVHVLTNRPAVARPGFDFYARNPDDAVRHWADGGFSHVYIDGGNVISQFLGRGLVDRMTITTAPILLGSGKRLFHRTGRSTLLRLERSVTFPSGMTQAEYHLRLEAPDILR
jgi:dihydrofolate reductase